jgi:hypothetical protein
MWDQGSVRSIATLSADASYGTFYGLWTIKKMGCARFLLSGGSMSNSKEQWFLFILAAAWLFLTLILTGIVYLLTHDVRALALTTLTAPPVAMLRSLYHYHFPPSSADYELQKLKLQLRSNQARNKKRKAP